MGRPGRPGSPKGRRGGNSSSSWVGRVATGPRYRAAPYRTPGSRTRVWPGGEPVSDLLERDPELKVIEDALTAASGGVGGAVLVEAPAGLGKSSLLGAARTRAQERGFTVLAARGRELERDFAFGVARQLFEARLRGERPAVRRRLLEGSAGLAAELLGLEPSASAPAAGAGAPYPQLHGLHWLSPNLAERAPLM